MNNYDKNRGSGWATNWTAVSKMCFDRKMNCEGCYYQDFFESEKCQCKYTVIELYRKFGEPPKRKDLEYE